MSFKRRLSVSIVCLVAVLTISLTLLYLRYMLRVQLRFAVQQAEMVAQQVELAGDEEQLPNVLLAVLGNSPLAAEIAVTDREGRMLAGFPARERWVRRPALRELAARSFLGQLSAVYGPQSDYEVSQALEYEDGAVWVVRVAVSTVLLRQQLAPQIRWLGVAAAVSLLASLALAAVFSRIVFRPLDRLGRAIDQMTRGEFAPPPEPPAGGDEYAALSSKLSLLGQQFRDAREGVSSLRGNMEQLVRKLEGAVLLFDAQDRLILANAAAETFLGLGRWQLMGRKLEEIFPAETELGTLVESAVKLRRPIERRTVELAPPRSDAEENHPARPSRVHLGVELMEDFGSRRRLGVVVTLRDADTRRQIEAQMETSHRLAAIARLTSGAAHEIKNPLNAISLHLELLKHRLAGSEVDSPPELDVIAAEMERLDRVVKTFLDFTRPVDLRLVEVPFGELLEEVAALAAPEAAQSQVAVRVPGFPQVAVQADRDLLKQAVLNLALNGIQAMPEGGELTLALSLQDEEAELLVIDRGVGIAPEVRDKIFRLYFTTKRNGSGIGLAMTFRVVQLHNGTIGFSSEPGQGTTFRLRFPVCQ